MANLVSLGLLLALLGALCRSADATAFEVGGDDGWVVPPASDGGMYNQWASKNRFLVGDSVRKIYCFAIDSIRFDPRRGHVCMRAILFRRRH
jgi:hypothetical protein